MLRQAGRVPGRERILAGMGSMMGSRMVALRLAVALMQALLCHGNIFQTFIFGLRMGRFLAAAACDAPQSVLCMVLAAETSGTESTL